MLSFIKSFLLTVVFTTGNILVIFGITEKNNIVSFIGGLLLAAVLNYIFYKLDK